MMLADGRGIDNLKRELLEFLEDDSLQGKYMDRLSQAIKDEKFRLIININDLRNFSRDIASRLVRRPREFIVAFQEAATDSVNSIDPTLSKYLKSNEIQIGFEGSLGRNSVSPRGLSSILLNSLVEVEGIVTRCSTIRPKLLKSVHFCKETNTYSQREYRDNTSLDIGIEIKGRERLPTGSTIPFKDAQGNPLEMEYGLSQFKDYQSIILQEMPERAKVGQLPRSVEVILEYDLADRVKPGDRIQCIGVYRPLPNVQQSQVGSIFKSVLIANNIAIIGKEVGSVQISGSDVKSIRELAKSSNVLKTLSHSFCPSIFGHDHVKKALILQLLGGMEKNLENGTHLRGDINVMLIGDPSTAKSQLLRAVLDIAPLAISTTGRGSSGVGLTAAVTTDSDSRDRRLEAGAMVLADRGIVCIDEFDKMNETDRVAIHEVMEQQTVTIAKAGIHASLNARCSVLAAANPVYGQYDRSRRPQDNIGLPDSLLSRFDLLFIILDQLDPTLDRKLSEYVVKSHQYRKPGTIMEPEPLNQRSKLILDTYDIEEDTNIWLKSGKNGDILTPEFLRKYIHYAKQRMEPVLSDDAMEIISNAYTIMRSKQTQRTLPVTARSLETIIRLSSASAKARLSQSVDSEDVDTALELLNYVLYHEGNSDDPDPNKGNNNYSGNLGSGFHQQSQIISDENMNNNNDHKRLRDKRDDDDDDDGLNYDHDQLHKTSLKYPKFNPDDEEEKWNIPIDKSSTKYEQVSKTIASINSETSQYEIAVKEIYLRLNESNPIGLSYERRELIAMLKELEIENKLMYRPEEDIIEIL